MGDEVREYLKNRGHGGEYARIQQSGHIEAVATSYIPITRGGILRTPPLAGAVKLRIAAGNVNDTFLGTGARTIRVTYLDTNLRVREDVLNTAGASVSALTTFPVFRLFDMIVETSGSYANYPVLSHAAAIVIEDESNVVWGTIFFTDIPRGKAQIGFYSVPQTLYKGAIVEAAYIWRYGMEVVSNKSADFVILCRPDMLNSAAAPYAGAYLIVEHQGVDTFSGTKPHPPLGPFAPGTDFGFLGKAETTASVGCTMDIVLAVK